MRNCCLYCIPGEASSLQMHTATDLGVLCSGDTQGLPSLPYAEIPGELLFLGVQGYS